MKNKYTNALPVHENVRLLIQQFFEKEVGLKTTVHFTKDVSGDVSFFLTTPELMFKEEMSLTDKTSSFLTEQLTELDKQVVSGVKSGKIYRTMEKSMEKEKEELKKEIEELRSVNDNLKEKVKATERREVDKFGTNLRWNLIWRGKHDT